MSFWELHCRGGRKGILRIQRYANAHKNSLPERTTYNYLEICLVQPRNARSFPNHPEAVPFEVKTDKLLVQINHCISLCPTALHFDLSKLNVLWFQTLMSISSWVRNQ